MDSRDKSLLTKYLPYLKGTLIMSEVKDRLTDVFQQGVVDDIFTKEGDHNKCSYMVEMLRKRDKGAMRQFFDILDATGHWFVADHLRKNRDAAVWRAEEEGERGAHIGGSRWTYRTKPDPSIRHQHSSDDPQREFEEKNFTKDESGDVGEASGSSGFASLEYVKRVMRIAEENRHRIDTGHAELRAQIKSLQDQVDEKDKRIRRLEDEREKMIVQYGQAQAEHKQQIEKLMKESEDSQSKLREQLNQTIRALNESERKLAEVQEIPKKIKKVVSTTEFNQLKVQNNQKDKKIEVLEKEKEKLEKEKEKMLEKQEGRGAQKQRSHRK